MKNVIARYPHMLHGGDYNPDQWLDQPHILEEDVRLMKEAGINCVSLAIFAWSHLEPEEGVYRFDWLAEIIDRLYQNEIYTVLATPSGAKPAWMAHRYPEIRRVSKYLVRDQQGTRHNHCYTSPVYREKVLEMDTRLARRFGSHPGVILWHLSNEYGGECYCPLCQARFRQWLQEKYCTLEALNAAWWSDFWSHRYTAWEQVEAPVPNGETATQGLILDWKRFVSCQTADFVRMERDAVKAVVPELPVTINMMGTYPVLDYFAFADLIDISSWDSYPWWGRDTGDESLIGQETAFLHDLMRSIKREPFLLMESSPSATNWQAVSKLRRPGVHMLASMQAVAHGSNSVQYFQWRKGRGACEKFHGAVVDHYGSSDTRVFREVAQLGQRLKGLDMVLQSCNQPQVAVIYDWENRWAVEGAAGPRNSGLHYLETVQAHHNAFWRQGVGVDVIDESCSLERYKLVVLPMVYMLRDGFAAKLRDFVQAGGTVVATYWTGIVNATDLCWLGGMPGDGLMELFGLRSEEIDALYDGQSNCMVTQELLSGKSYRVTELCDLIHCTTAQTLASYGEDFYKGQPALTVNDYGQGKAYYIAARAGDDFHDDFYAMLVQELGLEKAWQGPLPQGVTATVRKVAGDNPDEAGDLVFVQNYTRQPQALVVTEPLVEAETGKPLGTALELAPYEVCVLRRGMK